MTFKIKRCVCIRRKWVSEWHTTCKMPSLATWHFSNECYNTDEGRTGIYINEFHEFVSKNINASSTEDLKFPRFSAFIQFLNRGIWFSVPVILICERKKAMSYFLSERYTFVGSRVLWASGNQFSSFQVIIASFCRTFYSFLLCFITYLI
jgi:hypothetical protein